MGDMIPDRVIFTCLREPKWPCDSCGNKAPTLVRFESTGVPIGYDVCHPCLLKALSLATPTQANSVVDIGGGFFRHNESEGNDAGAVVLKGIEMTLDHPILVPAGVNLRAYGCSFEWSDRVKKELFDRDIEEGRRCVEKIPTAAEVMARAEEEKEREP